MLAPSSAQAPYPSLPRERESSSISLRLLSKSQSLCWIAILFFARRRNVGFCTAAAHTLACWAENRTQRRHAPHRAVRTFGTPAGSVGLIFSTVGKSALSARLKEIHRLPLLRQVSARIPFSLRAAMLSRTSRVIFLTEFEFQSPVGDITPGTMQRGNIGKTRVLLQNKCRVRRTT